MSEPAWSPVSATDADTAIVFREFLAIAGLHRQLMRRAFAKHCLPPAQALCILVLDQQGELTQSELAEALLLTRPSVTRLLQRMERAGLVARRVDRCDQRQVLVVLTTAGRELKQRLHEAAADYARATVALLPEHDRAQLARILPAWRRLAEQEAQN